MRSSHLPAVKTLDSFQLSIKYEQIDSLHEFSFVGREENVVLLGPPGVGKTHLTISLAIAAAQKGRRVYYGTLAELINSLEQARARTLTQSTPYDAEPSIASALVHNSDRGRELAWPRLPSSDHLAIRHPERRHGVENLAPDPCLTSLCRQPGLDPVS